MRSLVCILMGLILVSSTYAKPVLDRSEEARAFLLEKNDLPALKESYLKRSKWTVSTGNSGGYTYVTSIRQRWWKAGDQTEVVVEAGVFASREQALQAAELRVKELKTRMNLQDKMLKGGQLPGQAQGDRVWGLWDPPETDQKPNRCHDIGPVSRIAAVVFVKKEVAVMLTEQSLATSVDMGDLEALAKKVASKTRSGSDDKPQGN